MISTSKRMSEEEFAAAQQTAIREAAERAAELTALLHRLNAKQLDEVDALIRALSAK